MNIIRRLVVLAHPVVIVRRSNNRYVFTMYIIDFFLHACSVSYVDLTLIKNEL
jgi:hypothetical protein